MPESIEKDITILASSIFSQESLAKNEIVSSVAHRYDVKHELFRPEDVPALVRLRAAHPLDFNTRRLEQSRRFPLCLS
jgi:hypothetical protein